MDIHLGLALWLLSIFTLALILGAIMHRHHTPVSFTPIPSEYPDDQADEPKRSRKNRKKRRKKAYPAPTEIPVPQVAAASQLIIPAPQVTLPAPPPVDTLGITNAKQPEPQIEPAVASADPLQILAETLQPKAGRDTKNSQKSFYGRPEGKAAAKKANGTANRDIKAFSSAAGGTAAADIKSTPAEPEPQSAPIVQEPVVPERKEQKKTKQTAILSQMLNKAMSER